MGEAKYVKAKLVKAESIKLNGNSNRQKSISKRDFIKGLQLEKSLFAVQERRL
jgi:hypothetical protein